MPASDTRVLDVSTYTCALHAVLAAEVRAGLRERQGTQSWLAWKVGISEKHLSQMLTGRAAGKLPVWEALLVRVGRWPFATPDSPTPRDAGTAPGGAVREKPARALPLDAELAGWYIEHGVTCVVAPCCGFTFDASHTDVLDGGYSCPCCPPSAKPDPSASEATS
jgi:hypothetical protein